MICTFVPINMTHTGMKPGYRILVKWWLHYVIQVTVLMHPHHMCYNQTAFTLHALQNTVNLCNIFEFAWLWSLKACLACMHIATCSSCVCLQHGDAPPQQGTEDRPQVFCVWWERRGRRGGALPGKDQEGAEGRHWRTAGRRRGGPHCGNMLHGTLCRYLTWGTVETM